MTQSQWDKMGLELRCGRVLVVLASQKEALQMEQQLINCSVSDPFAFMRAVAKG